MLENGAGKVPLNCRQVFVICFNSIQSDAAPHLFNMRMIDDAKQNV